MKKFCQFALLVAVLLLQSVAYAENKAETFTLSPFVGGYVFDDDQQMDNPFIYGLRAGYNFTKYVGVEGVVDKAFTGHYDANGSARMFSYRVDALLHLLPDQKFVPYLAGGYGGIRSDYPTNNNGKVKNTLGAGNYGVGAKYYISDDVALRADVRHLVMHQDWELYNWEYTVGLTFAFGGAKPAPPAPVVVDTDKDGVADALDQCPGTPAGVPVDKNGCPLDSDGDGVADYLDKCPATPKGDRVDANGCTVVADADMDGVADAQDKCPGTPAGVKVDLSGCPADSDGDGVADYLDKCPATPKGDRVDASGCSISVIADADKDGVVDSLDKCPGTPAGVAVDQDGCPLDSDRDGVADYLDKCPGTPAGVKVDQAGCPVDTDGDGVADYLDKCPDTAQGVKVDKDGCPPPKKAAVPAEKKRIALELQFDTAKADVKSEYNDELKQVGDFLKANPGVTGVIEGYTDNVGSRDANIKLSQRRADSVRTYIIEKFGIAPERLTAKGHGPSNPIADNKTAAGRQKNRRISAAFFD
jgi:OOP family OmpA-OmpF porin